jgi:hypothetical protein
MGVYFSHYVACIVCPNPSFGNVHNCLNGVWDSALVELPDESIIPDALDKVGDPKVFSCTLNLQRLLIVSGDEVLYRFGVPATDVEDLRFASDLSFLLAEVLREL